MKNYYYFYNSRKNKKKLKYSNDDICEEEEGLSVKYGKLVRRKKADDIPKKKEFGLGEL